MTEQPSDSRRYLKANVIVSRMHLEAVCNYIHENITEGLIINDDEHKDQAGIEFYLPDNSNCEFTDGLLKYLNDIYKDEPFHTENLSVETVAETAWVENYRRSVQPILIDGRLVIRPPWAEVDSSEKIDIIIEPKMAFGTGSHETTQLCLIEILHRFEPGQSLLDLGCGSGVLSILAAKIGASLIAAVDIDPEAIANAVENVGINRVSNRIDIHEGSIEKAENQPSYDFIAANIMIDVIEKLFHKILKVSQPKGIIVLSGILISEEKRLLELLDKYGVKNFKITYMGEWLSATVINE